MTEYFVHVKDYMFYAQAKDINEAKEKIYKLIRRKCKLFRQYLGVSMDDYIVNIK